MDKQTNFRLCKRFIKQSYKKPPLFKLTKEGMIRTDERPTTNLKPDDFEIANLMSAGANVEGSVQYEKPTSIDAIDKMNGAVADFVESEKFNDKKSD